MCIDALVVRDGCEYEFCSAKFGDSRNQRRRQNVLYFLITFIFIIFVRILFTFTNSPPAELSLRQAM